MHLYKTTGGAILKLRKSYCRLPEDWDALVNREQLHDWLQRVSINAEKLPAEKAVEMIHHTLLPPIGSQEVWAAGVTYLHSRDARMEESKEAGNADCYQKVYDAERPELFFKALPHRVAGHGQSLYIRRDSAWNVPEPELTLFLNTSGQVQAYTAGNDMSSRSIEGENPLYLPQAKIYERSAALGPCLYIPSTPLSPDTAIQLKIFRQEQIMFEGAAPLSRMKRSLAELAAWLYKECHFPAGCFLMTGTCLVPPGDFTLQKNDEVEITIPPIGVLRNKIGMKEE
jgi:2-dehydro-3-deoxy-D-arabinonate dehydratase